MITDLRLNLRVWATALIPNRRQVRAELRSLLGAVGLCALLAVVAVLL